MLKSLLAIQRWTPLAVGAAIWAFAATAVGQEKPDKPSRPGRPSIRREAPSEPPAHQPGAPQSLEERVRRLELQVRRLMAESRQRDGTRVRGAKPKRPPVAPGHKPLPPFHPGPKVKPEFLDRKSVV